MQKCIFFFMMNVFFLGFYDLMYKLIRFECGTFVFSLIQHCKPKAVMLFVSFSFSRF